MRALRENPDIATLAKHAAIDVGVVTGKNEFFVLSRAEVERHQLSDFVVRLVGRSAHLPGAMLRRSDYQELADSGKQVCLLHLADHEDDQFSTGLRRYIRWGEGQGFHRGYKCRIRNHWHRVPSVWQPDCFMFRQIYDFPRAVVNEAGATSTDTIHRMQCVGPPTRTAAHVYTYLTAASAEIEGRSYGGGVLELEPTEAERLLVPGELRGAMPIEEADKLIRSGRLSEVLDHNDRTVLRDQLGLTRANCSALKAIWSKMRDRRLSRARR